MDVSKILKLFYIDSCDYSLNFLQNFEISVNAKFQITEENAISPQFYTGILPLDSWNVINKLFSLALKL